MAVRAIMCLHLFRCQQYKYTYHKIKLDDPVRIDCVLWAWFQSFQLDFNSFTDHPVFLA